MSQGLAMAFATTYGGSVIAKPVDGHRRQEWEIQPCGDLDGVSHADLVRAGQGVVRDGKIFQPLALIR